MSFAALLPLLITALKLSKTYWPVITAGVVLVSKVFTGDQSGMSEAISMLLAAWSSVNSGAKAAKAVQSIESRTVAVAVGPDLKTRQETIIEFASPHVAPDTRPDHPLIL